MGLRPEFENVRSSIQHRVPPPDIERAVADVRSEETRLYPLYWVGCWGSILYYAGCFRSGSCGWTCFGTSTLWSESEIWKLRWCIRPTRHVQDHMPCKKQAGSHDCRLSQAAECKLSSTVRRSSSCCSPRDAYWIGNFPIPLLHRASRMILYKTGGRREVNISIFFFSSPKEDSLREQED